MEKRVAGRRRDPGASLKTRNGIGRKTARQPMTADGFSLSLRERARVRGGSQPVHGQGFSCSSNCRHQDFCPALLKK